MTLRSLGSWAAMVGGLFVASCSDPAAPPPQGAMSIHIQSASSSITPTGKKCTIPAHNAQVAGTDTEPPSGTNKGDTITDGEGGTVKCEVSGAGASFSGQLKRGKVSFSINGEIDDAGKGTASIQEFDPDSLTTLKNPEDMPCEITVLTDAKGKLTVASGRIWAQFKCPGLITNDNPALFCSADDGYFVFENCS